MTTEKTLTVSDPHRAAVLLTCGCRLIDATTPGKGRRLNFVFSDVDNAARIASAAIIENRPLPINTFLENLRKCKELLYQWRSNQSEEVRF